MKNSRSKKYLILSIIFTILFISLTVAVKLLDTLPWGQLAYNDLFYKISKYLGYATFLPPIFFALLFVVQLFRRKSFKKIDRELKITLLFYLVVGAIYLFFDHALIINNRPIALDGEYKPSYPSSHTLFALTLCGSSILLIRNFLKLKHANLLSAALLLLAVVTIATRTLSGVHWATDIMAGVLIGLALVFAFAFFLNSAKKTDRKTKKPAEKESPEEHKD